ncbi:MAG TPA: hypothetical protein VNA89_02305 [Gemmatimonadaceae bacterium]|nr:hypothetical protein [Gemmatimonadaceae bacterium]
MTPYPISRAAPSRLPRRTVLLALGAAVLGACGDEPTAPPTAQADPAAATAAPPKSPERQLEDARADELGRALALALADPSLRGTVKQAMRGASNREHKLEVRRFLGSPAGARVASAVAERLGPQTGPRLTQLLEALPSLEVYLPVRSHREAWRGGADLIVAVGLHEDEAPRGFRLDGSRTKLDAEVAPLQPTLIVTQAETNFDAALTADEWENVEDAGGAAIGTMVRRVDKGRPSSPGGSKGSASASSTTPSLMLEPGDPCDPSAIYCEEPPPPSYPTYPPRPPGIWLDNMHVNDYEEPWYRGTAEIQVVLTGPGMNGWPGARLSCSGQYARTWTLQNDYTMKYFDQSGKDWSRNPSLLEGLLFSAADIRQWSNLYQTNVGVGIDVWEDDTGGDNCDYNSSGLTDTEAFFNDLRRLYAVASQVVRILNPTLGMSPVAIGISLANAIRNMINSGEDLMLGHAVNVRLADGSFSETQYRLVREQYYIDYFGRRRYAGTQDNGHMNITVINP